VEWFSTKAEAWATANTPPYRDRVTDVIDQDWNPNSFSIRCSSKVDPDAQIGALRTVLEGGGER
jgi:hypothetical protein